MGLKLITPPAVEPLSRTDAYVQCQIDTTTAGSPPVTSSDHDAWIDSVIPVVRIEAEGATARALITQEWELWLDHFPGQHYHGHGITQFDYLTYCYPENHRHRYAVRMPLPPLQTVESVVYVDENGDTQTLDPSQYVVDNSEEPARIVPAFGACWPRVQPQPGAVKVAFTAGYGDAADNVPKDLKHWMLLHLTHWFRNREASWQVTSTSVVTSVPYVEDLINRYTVYGDIQ